MSKKSWPDCTRRRIMTKTRPRSLAEVALIALAQPAQFDAATGEFLDEYWAASADVHEAMLRAEPA